MDETTLRSRLSDIGQADALRFLKDLDESGREKLGQQIEALDLRSIADLADTQVRNKAPIPLPKTIQPVQAFPRIPDPTQKTLYEDAENLGRDLLRQGKIGAFLVAGGQGTRLGYEGPKGEYPVTPIKSKSLFQVFAEQIMAHARDCGRAIPWYIMTSAANDMATREFFKKNAFFGFNPDEIFFFQQGMMPAFSMDGKMLLAERDSLALSPDGHGGSLRALSKSGALADMRRRGVEHLSYFQVDNPLVHCIDPLFLGLHALTGSEMSSKTIPKADALERVGNFVVGDGIVQVIEYSDLPEDLAKQTNPDGSLRFNAGSIAIHALSVAFVERLNAGGSLRLPWHRAQKKVAFVDEHGQPVKPEAPNAVKLEQFVFDAIPLARNALAYTTDRAEEFSPVKNAQGVDSPVTCRRDQIRRAARWLRECGTEVPTKDHEPDATLEISPLWATSANQLCERGAKPQRIKNGAVVYFGSNGVEGDV